MSSHAYSLSDDDILAIFASPINREVIECAYGVNWSTVTADEVVNINDVEEQDESFSTKGWRPLHFAARYNKNPGVIEALLAAGADIEAHAAYDGTPLHLAAEYNENPGVIEALLAAGADIEARAKKYFGYTPLHLAAWHNKNPVVIEKLGNYILVDTKLDFQC